MPTLLSYTKKDTWIHDLSGITKLIFFLSWSIVGMLSYDTRVLTFMLFASVLLFAQSKTDFSQVKMIFAFIAFFMVLNVVGIFIFAPYHGTFIYGSKTEILHLFAGYTITLEQIFYEFNVVLKYFTIIPIALMFILTTDPSEFASSFNGIGMPYTISYSIALALRYIPDIQIEFIEIKRSQEARGIDMSKNVPFFKRIRSMATILFPLVFMSMDRINLISNAMELRGFGKNKKRTWYAYKKLDKVDKMSIVFILVFSIISLVITFYDGSRFYNPFS